LGGHFLGELEDQRLAIHQHAIEVEYDRAQQEIFSMPMIFWPGVRNVPAARDPAVSESEARGKALCYTGGEELLKAPRELQSGISAHAM
jgi:hypothetical protein